MAMEFFKYQGTGNDFILIDNRRQHFSKNDTKLVAAMCDRKFGIGADGLILLEAHDRLDFTMVYYNSDGQLSTMCGNGGRCLVHFARHLGIISTTAQFEAVDGIHHATIDRDIVTLGMGDVVKVVTEESHVFLDTGSPHHVQLVNDVTRFDVFSEGRRIRNAYGIEGSNVNFVSRLDETTFHVRTYERGVEDETLSCGTGVTAVAIAMNSISATPSNTVELVTPGGNLEVSFRKSGAMYTDVYLKGPATMVFKGEWL